ncbi:MAG: ABC transporter permease subunit [Pseudomonadota bacterium]
MTFIFTIARREFKAYFLSPIAYVYLIVFLVAVSWFFFRAFFIIGQADMRVFFEMIPWIFLFFAPAITMGKWAEERKQGTLETLFTLPVRDAEIVIAKFLAGLALLATALVLTIPIALTVALLGNMDWGPVIGGYIGALLLGGAYLSIGLLISALTESQIIAFIGGLAGCFVMLVIGTSFIAGDASGSFAHFLQYMGLGTHFASIARGVIDSRDVIYYLSVIVLFLYLNLKVLKVRARR